MTDILSDAPTKEIRPGYAARQVGTGPRVLWIHGYTLDSSTWGHLWSRLPGYTHIGIDLPGHGASGPIPPDRDLRDLAADLAAIIEEQEIEHIVALSFGTMAALQVLIDHPTLARTVTLAAPAVAGGPQDPSMGAIYGRMIGLFHKRRPQSEITKLWLSSPAWSGLNRLPGLREALTSVVARHRWEELLDWTRIQLFTQPPQTDADLTPVSARVCIMVGKREMPAYQQCARWLLDRLPHPHAVTLPDAEHLCLLHAPDTAAAALQEHLSAGTSA